MSTAQHRSISLPSLLLLVIALASTANVVGADAYSGEPDALRLPADTIPIPDDSAARPDRQLRFGLIGGLNRRITPGYEPAEGVDYTTGGLTGLIRLTLVPEHLLRIGLESGYMKLTSVNDAPGSNAAPDRIVLTAIPALFTIAMGGDRFEFGGGVGFYHLLVSAGTTRRTSIASSGTELGYMANVSWHFPILAHSQVGADFRIYDFADRPLTVAVLGLSFPTPLFRL